MIDQAPLPSYKYIKICEGSVRVKIERCGQEHLRHFSIRNYPSLHKALEAAIAWRDETHMTHYGIPVLDKVVQMKGREKRFIALNPQTGEKLPELPTGLSYGFHRGRLLYVVASFQVDNRPQRKRFSISKLGLEKAIEEASSFRIAELQKGA
jgi:hypothetical protein